jgi:ankyrin repeat protein
MFLLVLLQRRRPLKVALDPPHAELLLQSGAKPDSKDEAGRSTLHGAASHGDHELVPLLAASPHQQLLEEKTPTGLTPLLIAVQVSNARGFVCGLCVCMTQS